MRQQLDDDTYVTVEPTSFRCEFTRDGTAYVSTARLKKGGIRARTRPEIPGEQFIFPTVAGQAFTEWLQRVSRGRLV